jgi:hypothetical protein
MVVYLYTVPGGLASTALSLDGNVGRDSQGRVPCYSRCSLLMLRRIALAFAGIVALTPAAADDTRTQVWLNPGMLSKHFKRDQDYRETNYGFGAEVFLTPEHGLIAGSLINSNHERSRYAGYHWRPLQLEERGVTFSAGLAFALIDGYSNTNDGHAFPIVLPTLSAEYGRLGAHLILLPHPKNSSAIGLQLRLRVW